MSFWGDLAAGVGGLVTGGPIGAAVGVLGAEASAHGVSEQNRLNAGMVQQQEDFQKEMSSTAYQRATADMKAAGINPMLAYMQGGASSPAGSIAGMQSPTTAAAGSAANTANMIQEYKMQNLSRTGQLLDNINKGYQGSLIARQQELVAAQRDKTRQEAGLDELPRDSEMAVGNALKRAQEQAAHSAADLARVNAQDVRNTLPVSAYEGAHPRLSFWLGKGAGGRALDTGISSALAAAGRIGASPWGAF